MSKPFVIGIGNPARGDDGAGPEFIRRLMATEESKWTLAISDGEPARIMDLWDGQEHVIAIDAVLTGTSPPGTVYRWDVTAKELPLICRYTSSHALGLAEAVEFARALGRLPAKMEVIGIEAESYESCEVISDHVSVAIDRIIHELTTEFAHA